MRRKTLVLAAALVVSLGLPAPAHALWGGGWLERLSGPGPFAGQVWDQRFLCVTLPKGITAADDAIKGTWRDKLTIPLGQRGWLTPIGCSALETASNAANRDKARLEVGFDLQLLHSLDNVLPYTQSGSGPSEIGLRIFAVTADVRVNRVVDVGTSLGGAWFRSRGGTPFEGFSKGVWQPMRMTVRPLAFVAENRAAEALSLRFDATKFMGTLTAEQFGADPGSFREPGEITWAWSIRVDVFALVK